MANDDRVVDLALVRAARESSGPVVPFTINLGADGEPAKQLEILSAERVPFTINLGAWR